MIFPNPIYEKSWFEINPGAAVELLETQRDQP
jgi:hypothetical protein